MKKFIKKLVILTCFILINISCISYADENKSNISLDAAPSYVITMPSSISIPYSNKGTFTYHIDFSEILLEGGFGLKVTLLHNNFTSLLVKSEMPYNLYYDNELITKYNTSLYFTVSIDDYYLNTFPSGTYTSTITIKIEYVQL